MFYRLRRPWNYKIYLDKTTQKESWRANKENLFIRNNSKVKVKKKGKKNMFSNKNNSR